MIVIGIDPGLGGAIAFLYENNIAPQVFDAPIVKVGSKKDFLVAEMRKLILTNVNPTAEMVAAIEKVHSMPKQGVASSFSFGKGVGYWIGILAALQIPYEEVTPQRWQGVMLDGMQKTKDASRLRAMQLFPQLSDRLNLKVHHGRADALLISEWRRRQG